MWRFIYRERSFGPPEASRAGIVISRRWTRLNEIEKKLKWASRSFESRHNLALLINLSNRKKKEKEKEKEKKSSKQDEVKF